MELKSVQSDYQKSQIKYVRCIEYRYMWYIHLGPEVTLLPISSKKIRPRNFNSGGRKHIFNNSGSPTRFCYTTLISIIELRIKWPVVVIKDRDCNQKDTEKAERNQNTLNNNWNWRIVRVKEHIFKGIVFLYS